MSRLSALFDGGGLIPHGFCLSWDPPLLALHIVSDAVIAFAYYTIPVALAVFVLRRRDLAFGWVFWLFAVFIAACGTTHVMAIWTLWHPDYAAEGAVKAVTAAASLLTAFAVWGLMPAALAVPSAEALRAANQQLSAQIRQRDAAVAALKRETAERLRAEEMLRHAQKMEALGHLTGGVAHGFNNLLMVILSNLEALESRIGADETARLHVDRAIRGVARGETLTHQLLAFGRRQKLRPVVTDLNAMLAELDAPMREAVGARIALALDCQPDVWPVEADAVQLRAAVMNLVMNARDAMPEGGTLSVKTANVLVSAAMAAAEMEMEAGEYVMLAVRDTGIGMTPDVVQAAFEPFFTTKPVGSGSGLGLSQVYGFVKQSRGHVTLSSEPGLGTSVRIMLKRAAVEPPAVQPVVQNAQA